MFSRFRKHSFDLDNPTIENALSQNLRSGYKDIYVISPKDSLLCQPGDTILFQLDNSKI